MSAALPSLLKRQSQLTLLWNGCRLKGNPTPTSNAATCCDFVSDNEKRDLMKTDERKRSKMKVSGCFAGVGSERLQ